jgi:hypothetical protein
VHSPQVYRQHHASGHIFLVRFQSILAKRGSYQPAFGRYVLLNPLPAGVVEQVWRWRRNYDHVVVLVRAAPCPIRLDADWQACAGWSLASERDIA